ncbi:MAG: hypothetical protein DLM68_04995 [Hyphomicrobiales bacterium]|nr:MAG: hypothetical protein DLM68_04995 [Hyphomicrobiales bacterium]
MVAGKKTWMGQAPRAKRNKVNRVAIISRCCKITTFQGPGDLTAPGGQAWRGDVIWRRNRGYDRISFISH